MNFRFDLPLFSVLTDLDDLSFLAFVLWVTLAYWPLNELSARLSWFHLSNVHSHSCSFCNLLAEFRAPVLIRQYDAEQLCYRIWAKQHLRSPPLHCLFFVQVVIQVIRFDSCELREPLRRITYLFGRSDSILLIAIQVPQYDFVY